MTPVLWLDPVAACAVANDCTRFGGQVPGHTRGSNWDWVPCGDCNGTGLVQPSGPQTMLIGATADMSDDLVYDYQDHLAAVDGPADVVWTSIGPHWGWPHARGRGGCAPSHHHAADHVEPELR